MQFIFCSLHQILNDDDEKYVYADATRELECGRARLDQVRRQAHRSQARPACSTPPRTAASTCRSTPLPASRVRRRPDARRLPRRRSRRRARWTRTGRSNRSAVNDILFDNLDRARRFYYPQQSFSVTEKADAGFVMANLSGDKWRGNVGVRFVRTEQTSKGNADRRRRLHAESVRLLYAAQRRPHVQRLCCRRELRASISTTSWCCASQSRASWRGPTTRTSRRASA